MKHTSLELESEGPPTDLPGISTRRDFTRRSVQAMLTISLLDHLCSTNLLAAGARLSAEKWLDEVNQIGLDVKGEKMKQTEWQVRIEDLLQNRIDLSQLLKLIDFERIEKTAKFVDNGARSIRPKFPKLEGVPERLVFGKQVFALRKGRSVVPHGHNNMATAFIILKGNFHGRHYDRVADEKNHMIIKPTIDAKFGPGQTSSISDVKDNVHWFKAEDEPAFIFNIHVFGLNPGSGKRTSRVYVDPAGEKLDDGLIRARLIDSKQAHQRYG
ncbi:MAG: hypothetical protein GY899_11665 [Verrucomicrobiaceae bacterium]|nr:hypothetical protein [Verrucomicrobiaceae bacterium]